MSNYPKWYVKHGAKVIDIYPGHDRNDFNANIALREKYAIALDVNRSTISICHKEEL